MNVSFYNGIKDVIGSKRTYDYLHYINDIRDGKYKDEVKSLRLELNKDKQAVLKSNLPNITFAGTFKKRTDNDLISSSGLAILDFDKLDNIFEYKETLSKIDLIHACFISPSGNGLKALVKIPKVTTAKEYKAIYVQLLDIFKDADVSCSNISRTCFVSWDEDLYFNDNSKTFEPKNDYIEPERDFVFAKSNIPILDNDIIADRLLKWFKGKYDVSQRNVSLFKLAIAFNDFGVDKNTAQTYLFRFEQKGFNQNEIQSILNSAYRKTENFGTKQFEDTEAKKRIQNEVIKGTPKTKIKQDFNQFSDIENEITEAQSKIKFDEFWKVDSRGRLEVLPYRFKLFLETLNFRKYYPNNQNKTFVLIKKEGNFIDLTSEFKIKDEVLNYLIDKSYIEAFDLCAEKTNIFSDKYLSILSNADIEVNRDDKECSYIYYKNLLIKVTADNVFEVDYTDLDRDVWRSQIIEREYHNTDHHDSQFRKFIWYACGQNVGKYNSLKSAIGYLLHGYKNSANNKAIIFNDEAISDTPNGGSGKGLILNAISKVKKTAVIDGKTFDFNKSFAYQTVNTDTQVLAFDDVKKNFAFENLFSVITEGITIEYKNQGAIKIPVKDSPKIIISTNYTVKADGDSFERRIFELEMSAFFNAKNTPDKFLGNMMFDDWDEVEWSRFDRFMINCIQYYLKNGLVKSVTTNLELKKFISETNQDFYEFSILENNIQHNERLDKKGFYEKFLYEYPDFRKWLKLNTFSKWIKKYADYNKMDLQNGVSNGQRWFMIVGLDNPKKIDIEDDFIF